MVEEKLDPTGQVATQISLSSQQHYHTVSVDDQPKACASGSPGAWVVSKYHKGNFKCGSSTISVKDCCDDMISVSMGFVNCFRCVCG